MQDLFLYLAGGLGLAIALVHGYIGEARVVAPSQAPTAQAKRILHAVMLISALYWFAASLLLLATPTFFTAGQRPIVVCGAAFLFATGSVGNLWATRGRHFGWILLAIATVLALLGL